MMRAAHETLDGRLDAVRTANDASRMQLLLSECLQRLGRSERVVSVSIQRIFYMPGLDFSAAYRLQLERDGERETQLLFGNIRYEGDDAELFAKAQRKAAKGKVVRPRLGEPAYHLPELEMVLWTYPNDPKLKTLRQSIDAGALREALQRLGGPDGTANGWQLGAVNQTLVRYIPRKRCVFRFEVEWRQERGPDGAPRALPASTLQHLYGKVYDTDEEGRRALAVQEALWRASQTDARWLRVPRPLHYDPELLLLWQTALPGTHLTAEAAQVDARRVVAIARSLALLHQVRLRSAPLQSLDDELEKTRQQARLMARVHPDLAPALREIETRLAAALPSLPRLPLVPAHGTFKLNHLLRHGDLLGLVDFDSVVLADPLYDVANFTADLHYLEAQGMLPPGRAIRLGRAFYESYGMHVPWGRRDAVLDWHVASLLVRKQAMKCVKHLHPNALPKMHLVLQEARSRLGRFGS